jgi:hypothetical protein
MTCCVCDGHAVCVGAGKSVVVVEMSVRASNVCVHRPLVLAGGSPGPFVPLAFHRNRPHESHSCEADPVDPLWWRYDDVMMVL